MAHQHVKGPTMTNFDYGFTSEESTDFLPTLAKDAISKKFMNAHVPSKPFSKGNGKGKCKDKVGTDRSTSQDTKRKFHCDQVGHMKDCQKRNSDSASAQTDVPSLT